MLVTNFCIVQLCDVSILLINKLINQLHAASFTQQGRQMEPGQADGKTSQILEALHVDWRNSTPCFASRPQRSHENINVNEYFTSSNGDRTHNQSILQSHFVPLRHDWPQY